MIWSTNVKWMTYIIDLRLKESLLWKNVKKKTRKNIDKCVFDPKITCSLNDESYFSELQMFRERLGEKCSTKKQFEKLRKQEGYWNFTVIHEDLGPLAGIALVKLNDWTVKEQAVWRNPNDIFNANDFLKWMLICWAKKNGFAYFDLGGIHPNPEPGTKEYNIRRYKSKFGGFLKRTWLRRARLGILRDKLAKSA